MYLGCKKEVADKRDYKAYVCLTKPTGFPKSYEIDIPEVKDQGFVNSCVAHSLASFLEETYKDGGNLKFSTGFIYGYRPVGYSQDQGMFPRQAIKTLLHVGDVPREKFDFNEEMPDIKYKVESKFEELKDIAEIYKIHSYARIYDKYEIMRVLYGDVTVPISIPVYNYLDYDKQTYVVKMPEGECQGYHMMLIVGWNEKGYIVQNSWGESWGNKGRIILPYDYPLDSAWAISTDSNSVYTYTTMWQKLYTLILALINRLKIYFQK